MVAREETDNKSQISCYSKQTALSQILRSLGRKAKEGKKNNESRSLISGSSRRTALSDVSVGSLGKKQKSEGKINNEEQRKEQLWDDLGKLKGNLNIQKNQCKGIVIAKDTKLLRESVQTLEEIYNEAIKTVLQLRELLPAEEARNIMEKVEREEMEIFELKKVMVKIMANERSATSLDDTVLEMADKNKEDLVVPIELPEHKHTKKNKEELLPPRPME